MLRLFAILAFILILIPSSVLGASSGELLNAIRNVRGDGIASNETLNAIAEDRAIEISINFSHQGAHSPWSPWGEILGWNNYPDDLSLQTVINGWLESPSHKQILLGQWSAVGVGTYIDPSGRKFYVALFAVIPVTQPTQNTNTPKPTIREVPKLTLPPTDM